MLDGEGPLDMTTDRLTSGLETLRVNVAPEVWPRVAQQIVSHRHHRLHQDPFTRRWTPIRVAMPAMPGRSTTSMAYGEADDDDSTRLGRRILDATAKVRRESGPIPQGRPPDRHRSCRGGGQQAARPGCSVRHVREIRASEAVQNREIGELIAFDQDARSLASSIWSMPPASTTAYMTSRCVV
jgi:hypothetical protein